MYEIFAFTRINTVVNESIFAKLFFPIFELNNFTKLFDMIIATILSQTMIFREMQQRIVFFLFFINILYIPDLNC